MPPGPHPADLARMCRDLAQAIAPLDGPEGWLAALRFGLAGGLSDLGEAEAAEILFRRILAETPTHAWAWIGLIDLALRQGDGAAAADLGRRALAHLPQAALVRRKTAEAVERAEGPAAAVTLLCDQPPDAMSPEDLGYAIALHRAARTVPQAAPLCARLIALCPDDPVAHLARIEIALQAGDAAAAVAAAEAAMAHHPGHPEILLRAAQAHGMAGDVARVLHAGPEAAAALLDALIAGQALPWYLALGLVARLWRGGARSEAARLAAHLRAAPWSPADRQAFAVEDDLLRLGPRAALAQVRAHPVPRRDAEGCERVGRVLLAAGTGALAARYLSACCRRWPDDTRFLRHAVQALIACGRPDRIDALLAGPARAAPAADRRAAQVAAALALGDPAAAIRAGQAASGPDDPQTIPIALIEACCLSGDPVGAEAALARLSADAGPLPEAMLCRPRATRVGTLLNEARILAARGDGTSDPAPVDGFFLAARRLILSQAARTAAPAAAPQTTPAATPCVAHVIWRDPPPEPPEAERLAAAWQAATRHPLRQHPPETAARWLGAHLGSDAARAHAMAPDRAQKADLTFLGVLLVEGGLALAAAQWPGGDLDALIPQGQGATLFLDGSGAPSFAAIRAPARHPVIATAFGMAMASCLARETDHRWFKTGPGLLCRALAVCLRHGGAQDVTLRPLAELRRGLHPLRLAPMPDPPDRDPATRALCLAAARILGRGPDGT